MKWKNVTEILDSWLEGVQPKARSFCRVEDTFQPFQVTNREVYIAILYSACKQFITESERLEAELTADRGYPIVSKHVGPKLEVAKCATEKLLYASKIFVAEMAEGDEYVIPERIINLLEQDLSPLLRKMAGAADEFPDEEPGSFYALVESAVDYSPLRIKMETEFAKFTGLKAKIESEMEKMKRLDSSLSEIVLDPLWVSGGLNN